MLFRSEPEAAEWSEGLVAEVRLTDLRESDLTGVYYIPLQISRDEEADCWRGVIEIAGPECDVRVEPSANSWAAAVKLSTRAAVEKARSADVGGSLTACTPPDIGRLTQSSYRIYSWPYEEASLVSS